jgi:hypothetical protein
LGSESVLCPLFFKKGDDFFFLDVFFGPLKNDRVHVLSKENHLAMCSGLDIIYVYLDPRAFSVHLTPVDVFFEKIYFFSSIQVSFFHDKSHLGLAVSTLLDL